MTLHTPIVARGVSLPESTDQVSLMCRMKAAPPAATTIIAPPTVSVPIGEDKNSANLL